MFAFLTSVGCGGDQSVAVVWRKGRKREREERRTIRLIVVVLPAVAKHEPSVVDELVERVVRVGLELGLHRREVCGGGAGLAIEKKREKREKVAPIGSLITL